MADPIRTCTICGADTFLETCPTDGSTTRVIEIDPTLPPGKSVGETVGGRYRLASHSRVGLHSRVYIAEHLQLGNRVSLDLMIADPATMDAQHVQRFERSARLTAQLTSRHTTRVLDFGRDDDGRPYVVTEYIPGRMLSDVVQWLGMHGERIELDAVCEIAGAILLSLAEVHAVGLVHRNVQPGHVLLCRPGLREFDIKLTDFGLVRPSDSQLTAQSTVLGTPAFMSPEQIRSQDVDGRSDLYSLGVMLHLLATGKLPFNNPDPLTLIFQHVRNPVPKVELPVRSRQGKFLAHTIERLLSKDPNDRFSDAEATWRAMEFIHGRGVGDFKATRQLLDDMEADLADKNDLPDFQNQAPAVDDSPYGGATVGGQGVTTTPRGSGINMDGAARVNRPATVLPAPAPLPAAKPAAGQKRPGGLGGLLDNLD